MVTTAMQRNKISDEYMKVKGRMIKLIETFFVNNCFVDMGGADLSSSLQC